MRRAFIITRNPHTMSVFACMMVAMNRSRVPRSPKNYVVGIDVGTNSVGLTALEIDEAGPPTALLSAISQIHDSGVLEPKTATTRFGAAGVARRMRRLRRRRSKRLNELDRLLTELGWMTDGDRPEPDGDPHFAWRARAQLSVRKITDIAERNLLLAVALRHMARHRGWRNPYVKAPTLYIEPEPS